MLITALKCIVLAAFCGAKPTISCAWKFDRCRVSWWYAETLALGLNFEFGFNCLDQLWLAIYSVFATYRLAGGWG